MNRLLLFSSGEHLTEIPTSAVYSVWFLYLCIFVLVLPIGLAIFLKVRGREKVYRNFDRLWLWGYFTLGALGLFVWFAIDQGLPLFGTRLSVLIWLIAQIGFGAFLYYYFRRKTVAERSRYLEKKRKEKYLK